MSKFINADCLNVMRQYPDDYFDLAIVDPPYFSGPEKRKYYGRKISPIGVQRLYGQRRLSEICKDYELKNVPFCADNSDNLEEAIQCYVHYGELPISGNFDDFWKSYKKFVETEEKQND